ncbi:MAG: hypothetical protein H7Y59_01125 [Anaerolineales bacterium]|nr:hypothetical protein [Anaerolineales bacterium]
MAQKLLQDNWHIIRIQLREWWNELTVEDLDKINGSQEQLVQILQGRYGYTRNLALFEIEKRLAMYYNLELQDPYQDHYKSNLPLTPSWNERAKEYTRNITYRSKYMWKDNSSTKLFILLEKHMHVFRQKREHVPEGMGISN